MPERKQPVEVKVESIEQLQDSGPGATLILEEDAWEFAPPPPKGVYALKCFLGKDGEHVYKMDENDPSTLFCQLDLECRIVNSGEYDDTPVFTSLSTRVFPRKNNSTMASFVVKSIGLEQAKKFLPAPVTPKALAHVCKLVLKKEPSLQSEIDWRGGYMGKNKKGDDEWTTVYNHYEDFPQDPNDPSRKLHMVTITGQDGMPHEVRAQVKVVRFFGKGDKIPTIKQGHVLVSAPRSVMPVATEVEEIEVAQFVPAKGVVNGPAPTSAEMDIMLE